MNGQEKTTIDQYGRKKWNIELYAQEARDKKRKRGNDDDEVEFKLRDDSSQAYVKHRDELLKTSLNAVKTYNLINPDKAELSVFGSRKRFGFFCPICDLSFRDNLALIDHFNSPQHANKVILKQAGENNNTIGDENGDGESAILKLHQEMLDSGVRRATLNEVVATMEKLIQQSVVAKSKDVPNKAPFAERVKRRREFEEKKRLRLSEKRILRKHQRRERRQREEELARVRCSTTADTEMNQMMGFSTFGSTKRQP